MTDLTNNSNKNESRSAEEAVRDIEEEARSINKEKRDRLKNSTWEWDFTPGFRKDPNSRFMTANDVTLIHKLMDLGVVSQIKRKKTNKVMNVPHQTLSSSSSSSGLLEELKNSADKTPSQVQSILSALKQSCPICSAETHSYFMMTFVEEAGVFHCYRCSLVIDPFEAKDPLPVGTAATEFGVTAIHDTFNPDHESSKKHNNKNKPVMVSSSSSSSNNNNKRTNIIESLKEKRRSAELDSKLSKIRGSSSTSLTTRKKRSL